MYCLPRYLLMVFAFAGDSTITRAFAISNFLRIPAYDYRRFASSAVTGRRYHTLTKFLPGSCFTRPEDLQFEQRGDDFGGRSIFHLLNQIVQMHRLIQLQLPRARRADLLVRFGLIKMRGGSGGSFSASASP